MRKVRSKRVLPHFRAGEKNRARVFLWTVPVFRATFYVTYPSHVSAQNNPVRSTVVPISQVRKPREVIESGLKAGRLQGPHLLPSLGIWR